MIFAIDFDGCLCDDTFPKIGAPKWHVIQAVKYLKTQGHQIILWTCRGGGGENDINSPYYNKLTEAVEWCKGHGLEFDAINDNVEDSPHKPYPKIYFDYVIDDKNIFCHIDTGTDFQMMVRDIADR